MNLFDQIHSWRRRHGDHADALETLLRRAAAARTRDAETLGRLHEDLLFLRAYPPSAASARLCDELLAGCAARVAALGENLGSLEEPEMSGIAGTAIAAVFTYATARGLAARCGSAIDIDWEGCANLDRIGPTLAEVAPRSREEWPVEAHLAAREWVEGIKPRRATALQWLLGRLAGRPDASELYDRMDLMLLWRLGESAATRTHGRYGTGPLFIHDAPLIPRRAVSLASELEGPPLPVRRLAAAEARRALAAIVDTSAVRYRELYGFNFPDSKHVYVADAGRGLEIVFFGVPPGHRLPLRAYHAGMFFKNGVPSGYVEVLSLCERAEVGFNLYYTFREGETAWIYARLLRLCKQLLGVTRYYLDPYQTGHENEEAIASGAFWFYRKLGFRSVDPELRKLTEAEERRMARQPERRTPAPTLRRLGSRPMIWEPPGETAGEWDRFHIRKLALARWPGAVKRAFESVRPAKHGPEESRYLRMLQRDPDLRAALIRLGS